ncbi:MAG: hypothetical protein EAZ27_07885 [Cytophagales bacterium]|nr:MAG: hypothetical protein EAZ27_07885 [Cytophagales bacterium]
MKLTFKIKKSINIIFDYLTDMQKFVKVHPVIYQIDNLGNENYLVHENLKFDFVPFSFTYPVIIEKNISENKITIQAKVFKLIKIEMKFHLKADSDFTIIEEEINIKSLLPVEFIIQSIFRKQHNQLFKNIEIY